MDDNVIIRQDLVFHLMRTLEAVTPSLLGRGAHVEKIRF